MIDPIDVLNSVNVEIPEIISGTIVPDGAGGYVIAVPADWILPVIHYVVQPILMVLLMVFIVNIVLVCFRVIR